MVLAIIAASVAPVMFVLSIVSAMLGTRPFSRYGEVSCCIFYVLYFILYCIVVECSVVISFGCICVCVYLYRIRTEDEVVALIF